MVGKKPAASPSHGASSGAPAIDDLPVIVEADSPAAPSQGSEPRPSPPPAASGDEGHFVFDDGAAVDIAASNLPEHRQWGAGKQWVDSQAAAAAASPAAAPAPTATVAPAPMSLPVPMTIPRPGSAGIRLPAVLPSGGAFPSLPPAFPGRAPLSTLPMRLPLAAVAPPAGAPAAEGSPRVQAVSGSVAGSSRRGSRALERKTSSGTPPHGSPSLSARGGPDSAATLLLDSGAPGSSPAASSASPVSAQPNLPHQVADEFAPQADEDEPEW
jgi:hypothetical protein